MSVFAQRLQKFVALPGTDQRIFMTAVLVLPAFWWGLRTFGFSRMQRWIDRTREGNATPRSMEDLLAIGTLVNIAANYAPGTVTCLTRSMVLVWLLRRRGVPSQLRIGVRLVQGALEAHAWVECAGLPINDRPDVREQFAPFSRAVSPELFR